MGIFDLFNSPQAAAPAPAAPAPTANPDYNTFLQNLIAAKVAQSRANPTNVLSWLTGDATKAATAGASADAPALFNAFKQLQAGSQGAQLNNTAGLAAQGAMANTNIDPNDIAASQPAIQASLAAAFNPPSAGSGTPMSALQQQRAFYDRMGNMLLRMPGGAPAAKELFALRDKGLPEGTTTVRGVTVDGASGSPLSGDVGAIKAAQATPTEVMKTNEANRHSSFQGGVDVGVHAANANKDASLDLVEGLDPKTGLPTTSTRAAAVATPGSIVKSNPFFEGQQAETKDLRTKAESADQGLDLAMQIHNSANGLLTGKGANALQDVRKMALTASNLIGANPNLKLAENASKFEQLKFASQQLVAVASHNLSPRVAMNIYNQISAVKPGDQSSMRGLQDIIKKQIVPALMRDKAVYSGTSSYYQANPFKNDAATVVPGQNPLENFHVKDVHGAQPGEYFIDPLTGNLRQRPKQ